MSNANISLSDRQQAYIKGLEAKNFKFTIAVGEAFVRGIRDIGYKNTASALNELIDNAYEAGASNVHVVLHDDGTGRKNNVTQIAVVDDGSGMIPDMLRAAVIVGGTDREQSRQGIGRFGYGLPCGCLSQGERFEVFSRIKGGEWYSAGVDVEAIERGDYTSADGDLIVPKPQPAKLPKFVQKYVEEHFTNGLESGTVVVLDKLDALSQKSVGALFNALVENFGITYHKLRANFEIAVDGERVQPCDPLFLTPGYKDYDIDSDRAQALDPLVIEIKDQDTKVVQGLIRVRYALFPTTFGAKDKSKKAIKGNQNGRFPVLRDYGSIIVSRMSRIMDHIYKLPDRKILNNDNYWRVELEFDASLDEYFNVPTTKQRVDLDDRIWQKLEEYGLYKAIEQMRSAVKKDMANRTMQSDSLDGLAENPRPSEEAMQNASKMAAKLPDATRERLAMEGQKRFQQEVQRRVQQLGQDPQMVEEQLEAELANKAYKVGKRAIPGGVFFQVEQLGATKMLWLNTECRFFNEVYAGPGSSPQVRAALEILLFAIGDRKLEGRPELQAVYDSEIPEWSKKVELALSHLANSFVGFGAEAEAADETA